MHASIKGRARNVSRRAFLANTATAGLFSIIPARVLRSATAPSNQIALGQIGCGRIAREMDIPDLLKCDRVRHVAVADFDLERARGAQAFLEEKQQATPGTVACTQDYRELLASQAVDAVVISTPDHWHVQPAIEAAFAGKDVYVQKPAMLTIEQGRLLSNAISETKAVFQLGSQLRSFKPYQRACTLVRNGRLGKVHTIQTGFPGDPPGGRTAPMPVPASLNYDAWLGSTPEVFYNEDRVHPQRSFKRPGWLRCEQFGAGMVTGWGSHHLDIIHWAMGWERLGPLSVEGRAAFLKDGLWDVHGDDYELTLTYPGDVRVQISNRFPPFVRFVGERGWISVSRGALKVTPTDPLAAGRELKALDASDTKLLAEDPQTETVKLNCCKGLHQQDWVDSIRERRESNVPAEVAHRSCSACLVAHAGMKLGRKLTWDYQAERFVNDDEANALLARAERAPYGARRAYEALARSPRRAAPT